MYKRTMMKIYLEVQVKTKQSGRSFRMISWHILVAPYSLSPLEFSGILPVTPH